MGESLGGNFEIQRYIEKKCHPVFIPDIIIAHPEFICRTLSAGLTNLLKINVKFHRWLRDLFNFPTD